MPGAHKIGTAISGPRIAGRKITDTRLSLTEGFLEGVCEWVLEGSEKGSEKDSLEGSEKGS